MPPFVAARVGAFEELLAIPEPVNAKPADPLFEVIV